MAQKIRFFCTIISCFCLIGSAWAQTAEKPDLSQERPQCSSSALYQKVMQAITAYTDTLPAASTLDKRHKALIAANVEQFEDVPVEDFSAEDDFNTANALISIKINKKISEQDIVICRQTTQKQQPLYLILYPENGQYQGYILNLDEYSSNFEDISFVYP